MKKYSSKENRHKVCYKAVLDGEAFIRYYFEMLKLSLPLGYEIG